MIAVRILVSYSSGVGHARVRIHSQPCTWLLFVLGILAGYQKDAFVESADYRNLGWWGRLGLVRLAGILTVALTVLLTLTLDHRFRILLQTTSHAYLARDLRGMEALFVCLLS